MQLEVGGAVLENQVLEASCTASCRSMALKFPGAYAGGVNVTIRSGESGTSFDTFRACASPLEHS
jgi:hypothetical protein